MAWQRSSPSSSTRLLPAPDLVYSSKCCSLAKPSPTLIQVFTSTNGYWSPVWSYPLPDTATLIPLGAAALSSLSSHSLSSHTHQWELQPIRGVSRIPLAGLLPVLGISYTGGCLDPAWHGPPTVSAFTGGCGSLAQPGAAHTLSLLSCVPAGAKGWPNLACLQTNHAQMLMSPTALAGQACPQPRLLCSPAGAVA